MWPTVCLPYDPRIHIRRFRDAACIARLAGLDGLKGRWGEPVTANALRRVFTRVDAEIQAQRAKEQEAELVREEQERRAQNLREWKERVGRL